MVSVLFLLFVGASQSHEGAGGWPLRNPLQITTQQLVFSDADRTPPAPEEEEPKWVVAVGKIVAESVGTIGKNAAGTFGDNEKNVVEKVLLVKLKRKPLKVDEPGDKQLH
ncbi:hypothetical protein TRICI_005638 [Trichomonascus ciferrii]|uniref:Uncharacterized protein n=1 Tax=Trichomonascus ciferrii TaxID=44093 RepID=A0A642UR57_9ASCO|nr:hypothetical protein TRICI_005638 [Trichomonascus ciferrii]